MRSTVLLSVLLSFALCLSACGKTTAPPAETAAPEVTQAIVTEATQPSTMTTADYVELRRTETDFGWMEIPSFRPEALDSQDTRAANRMFSYVESRMLEAVESCRTLAEADQWDAAAEHHDRPLCQVQLALNDGILSLAFCYGTLDYYGPFLYRWEAVNIDIATGATVPYAQLLEIAGYTQEEAETSVRQYADRNRTNEWEQMTYHQLAADGQLPIGRGDPSPAWEADLDLAVEIFRNPPLSQGTDWDELDRYPTVFYEGYEQLSVLATVPTAAGSGWADVMVRLGRTPAQVYRRNPQGCYGEPIGSFAMNPEDAALAVAHGMGMPEASDFTVESMILLQDEENHSFPVYVVPEQTADGLARTWAVHAFTGAIYNRIGNEPWAASDLMPGSLVEDLLSAAEAVQASAALRLLPDSYDCWSAEPWESVDLTEYGSGLNRFTAEGVRDLMLCSAEDHLVVSFQSGAMNRGEFESQSTFFTMELNTGECVRVWFAPQQGDTVQAITVYGSRGVVSYVLHSVESPGTEVIE